MNLLALLVATVAISQTPSPVQSQRIAHLEDSLLAPCCYTQPVSKHMSDVALEMRQEISQMVLSGESDQTIVKHYEGLYGLQILVDPEGNFHKVVYGLPPVTALVGLIFVLYFMRHSLTPVPVRGIPNVAVPPGFEGLAKYKKQIQSELAEDEASLD